MLEIAVSYGILAWLTCWWADVTFLFIRSPLFYELDFKFVVLTICLIFIVFGLYRNRWLLWKD